MTKQQIVPCLKRAASGWSEDHATRLSAALAYYTMLSIAPLLIFTIKFIGVWYRNAADARTKVTDYLQQFTGAQAAAALQTMTEKASQPGQGTTATVISIIVLLFSAGGVFGELQDSMNVVWGVKPDPNNGWMDMIRQRFFSLTLVLGTAFMLLASLLVNAVLASIVHSIGIGWFWAVVNFIVSLVVVAGLFALIFKYLPDAKVPWEPALYGAGLSAIAFTIGRIGLAYYLGRGSATSVYGAAGSLAAMLIWTYYNGWILFFGAEFSKAIATENGHVVEPTKHAVVMQEQDRIERGSPHHGAIAHAAAAYRPMPLDIVPRPLPEVPRRRPVSIAVAGLAAGALLGGVGVWLSERAGVVRTSKTTPEELQQRIRDLELRIRHAQIEQRKFKARTVDQFVREFKAANAWHVPESLKTVAHKVARAVKDRMG